MKARTVILLCLAINITAGQRILHDIATKGSTPVAEKSMRRNRLLSKSEKEERSKSKKGRASASSVASNGENPSTESGSPPFASAEEESPQMIMVAPLESSAVTETSSIDQAPTPGPTENRSQETDPAEDMAIDNTVIPIMSAGDYTEASVNNSTETHPVTSLGEVPEAYMDNATETHQADPPVQWPTMLCPIPGYFNYAIPAKTLFRYPHTRGNTSVVLTVTDTCSYIIEMASGTEDTFYAATPLEWIDASVHHFGGAPRNRRAHSLSGLAAPSLIDLDLQARGASVFEVVIKESSASVAGDKPLSWIFLSETEAKEFEYFLASLTRYAPDIFLTNESSACGSGPFCSIVGNIVCFHDPMNHSLAILHLNGDEYAYYDSFEWFSECVGALECSSSGNSTFSYSSCPAFEVNGTMFSFTDESISFECPTENAALLMADMVQMLSFDPFHPLAIGAPDDELGSHHHTGSTDCMA